MKFILEKHIPASEDGPGSWYYEGTYSPASIDRLCTCCFLFGSGHSTYDNVRVTVMEDTDSGNRKKDLQPEGGHA